MIHIARLHYRSMLVFIFSTACQSEYVDIQDLQRVRDWPRWSQCRFVKNTSLTPRLDKVHHSGQKWTWLSSTTSTHYIHTQIPHHLIHNGSLSKLHQLKELSTRVWPLYTVDTIIIDRRRVFYVRTSLSFVTWTITTDWSLQHGFLGFLYGEVLADQKSYSPLAHSLLA